MSEEHWTDVEFRKLKGFKYGVMRYRPNFVTGFPEEFVGANSIKEIFEIDFVKQWRKQKENKTIFLAMEYDYDSFNERRHHIMAFLYPPNKEPEWWVVAIVKELEQ